MNSICQRPVRTSRFSLLRTRLARFFIRMSAPAASVFPQLGSPHFYAMMAADATAFILSFAAAYLIRFEFTLSPLHRDQIRAVLPLLVPAKLALFWIFGLYRGMWQYCSMDDCRRLAQAVFVSSLCCLAGVFILYGFTGFSRSVFLLDALITFLLAGGCRLANRAYHSALSGRKRTALRSARSGRPPERILIVGAGMSGEKIMREIHDNPRLQYEVVCFLDDDPAKRGRTLHGVPVFGAVEDLPRVVAHEHIRQVFVSIPSATGPQMRRIVEICKDCDVPYKTLPAIGQIMNGNVSISDLRDVNYEDLLRRPPIRLDETGIQGYLSGGTVLVTGAGGSIGSELCRQLLRFTPRELILVDAGEKNLYEIQMELRHALKFQAYRTILAKVQNRPVIEDVFRTYRPDVVFHAAAYKHVPMLERNPWEAIYNNVLGSQVVMETAAKYATRRFVLVSTDKAVRPTSVMGASKRIAELILQSMQGGPTRFMAVRFGNVLASSGSVILLFQEQIRRGGPLTVTHPKVTRYLITIPEACQLTLQAGALGRGGEIFVLEMGRPVNIADLAKDLIRLSGKEPDRDIEIVYTGLRPGEKLHEELFTRVEAVSQTAHRKIMVLKHNGLWNWNGLKSRAGFRDWLRSEVAGLQQIAGTHDAFAIKSKLKELVAEYSPQETDCVL